jgi:hypothetical protein
MSIELKIKSKHLALEPAIIRKEERKILNRIRSGRCNDTAEAFRKYESLHNHRKWNVRNESRATYLTRAFLAGIPYKNVERKVHSDGLFFQRIMPRIVDMVAKYGPSPIQKYWNKTANRMDYKKEEYDNIWFAVNAWYLQDQE